MKTWIKTYLREGLDEMRTKSKKPYDGGAFHMLYQTKKNPNVLYKVGIKDIVSKWVKVFQEYPQFFPKIYKVGEFADKYHYYVEIEKLDANRSRNEWAKLYNLLDQYGVFSYDAIKNFNIYSLSRYFEYINNHPEYEKEISSKIKLKNPEMYDIYRRWTDLVLQIEVITQFELGESADIHGGNFAYNAQGELKCIDI